MANTEAYKAKIEEWYLQELISMDSSKIVSKEKVKLKWGGRFEYDVVIKNKDEEIEAVYCLSCSAYKTSSGKAGTGKLLKIKADAMMMLGTDVPKKVLAFTGISMYKKVKAEQKNGRFPYEIILEYIDLKIRNKELYNLVERTISEASEEINTGSWKKND